MAETFIGEITMMGCNFAPINCAFCNGAIIPIAQNTALFSILGTTYGGNGTTTFALPNLQGRLPMHTGSGPGLSQRVLGEQSGSESVALNVNEMAAHTHTVSARSGTAVDSPIPAGRFPSTPANGSTPYADAGGAQMAGASGGTVGVNGSGLPHNNLMPALCINFVITMFGIFPSRN